MKRSLRTARLAYALDSLARIYRTRKNSGREVAFLFPRCFRLSKAWLESREADLQA